MADVGVPLACNAPFIGAVRRWLGSWEWQPIDGLNAADDRQLSEGCPRTLRRAVNRP
jgi:hypothetical protein